MDVDGMDLGGEYWRGGEEEKLRKERVKGYRLGLLTGFSILLLSLVTVGLVYFTTHDYKNVGRGKNDYNSKNSSIGTIIYKNPSGRETKIGFEDMDGDGLPEAFVQYGDPRKCSGTVSVFKEVLENGSPILEISTISQGGIKQENFSRGLPSPSETPFPLQKYDKSI